MKVCLINNLYQPYARGGAEQVVKNLAIGLKQAGHQVFVITTANHNHSDTIDNIKVYYIKPKNLFWFGDINTKPAWLRLFWHGIDMFNLSGRNLVKQILQQEQPDLVNTHNLKGISYLIPLLLKKLGLKHYHTLHDIQLVNPSGLLIVGQEKSWQNYCVLTKLYKVINRWLFGSPDVVISPSQWLLEFYQKRGFFSQSKLVKLPNPVSDEVLSIKHKVLSNTNRQSTFLYLGQIEKHKGILFLIEAMKKFHGEWRLKIVGDGTQLTRAKKLAGDDQRFEFFGRLTGKQLTPIWQSISFTILPSLCYENSPTVIYESLACGKPVIVANIGGAGELVNNNQNGFTFTAGDENYLLSQIKKCPGLSQTEYQQMSQNACQSVEEYEIEEYIEKFLQFIKK